MTTVRSAIDTGLRSRWFYASVFVACLVPGLIVGYEFYRAAAGIDPDALGADPAKELLHTTGRYALAILLVTLAITPIRRLTGFNAIQRVRRMLGLWSFAYALCHLSTYLVFQQLCYSFSTCQWHEIGKDFVARPFTVVGLLAFSMLLVLALTSTNGWMRRLGRRWRTLHRLSYAAAIAGIVHFAWGQKSDIRQPLEWAVILAILLGVRVLFAVSNRRRRLVTARA